MSKPHLLLIRDAFYAEGSDLTTIRAACVDTFEARAVDARVLGVEVRSWPPIATAYDHWSTDFTTAATAAGLPSSLVAAVADVNAWIAHIDAAL
jgi:hypothetical protein